MISHKQLFNGIKPTSLGQVQSVPADGEYALRPGTSMMFIVLLLQDRNEAREIIRFGPNGSRDSHTDICHRVRDELSLIPSLRMHSPEQGAVLYNKGEMRLEHYGDGTAKAQALLEKAYAGVTTSSRRVPENHRSLLRR